MDAEEAEGFGLKGRGSGEDIGGHGSLGSGLNAVARERGEVGEQRLEAVDGKAVRGALAACLRPKGYRVRRPGSCWNFG